MSNLQRLSPCGRVEPQAYGGRKIRDLYSYVKHNLVCGNEKRYNIHMR